MESDREKLRTLVRDYTSYKKWAVRFGNALKIKANGEEQKRPTAYSMTEDYKAQLESWMDLGGERLSAVEKQIGQAVKALPIWTEWANGISGVGPLSIGYLEAYVDLDRAVNAEGLITISKVWRFCGYGAPEDRHGERGKKRCYVAALKAQLYTLGMSLEKTRNILGHKYGKMYDERKLRMENSDRIVEEVQKGGKVKEVAWKDAKPCHRRDDAIRRMIKEFLKDYVIARAALEGKTMRPPYSEEYLGKKHSV